MRTRTYGSGGTVVLPDQTDSSGKVRHLAIGAGKASILYMVDRDAMGKFNPSADASLQKESSLFARASVFHACIFQR